MIFRYYLLDAGTSRFDSSLWYFLCAYDIRRFDFDRIFGWEYTIQQPREFWEHVPKLYTSRYHFYNYPVASDPDSSHSPSRVIKEIANPGDFIAFKLDIDTSSIEIPIAMSVASDPELRKLVSEFFFEFHFLCPILRHAWGSTFPNQTEAMKTYGIDLTRYSVMKLFSSYREHGIREFSFY